MKITIIHGQNHKGSSYQIGRILIEKMGPDVDVTEFFLPRDLNHFCTGCYQCIEDDEKCPFAKDKHVITSSIEMADLLIFTTPTYCMRASAPMKSLIDLTFTYWMPHRPRASMFRKKAVVISTAAGMGMKAAMKDITTSLFYWGVPYIQTYGMAVQAMNWAGVHVKKKAKIDADMTKLANKLRVIGIPRVGLKTKLMFLLMMKMQKDGFGSSVVEKQYWNDMGWLGKQRPWNKLDKR